MNRVETAFDLVRWFRVRMLPLVVSSALVVAAAAPLAYHQVKRRELFRGARADAVRVAEVLGGEIAAHPTLWRYHLIKLAERLGAAGLGRVDGLVVRDADGAEVPVAGAMGLPAPPRRVLYGRAEVAGPGPPVATVWVAVDAAPLWTGTLTLAGAFAALAVALGAVLYLVPMWAIRTAQRRVHALTGRLALTLQEEDRRRIARDLHDGAGQALAAARLQLLAARRRGADGDEALARAARHLDEALDEVRRSTYALMPPLLGTLGLRGALERHCADFAESTGLHLSCQVEPDLAPLPPAVETACYRIAQEALTNTARHAGAVHAWLVLRRDGDALRLTVSDDGTGRAERLVPGAGLLGVYERARLLGGEVTLAQRPGSGPGLHVDVRLPAR